MMKVPATINKVFHVVEYGFLAEPVLPSNVSPSGLPYTHSVINPVQNIAICRKTMSDGYIPIFGTRNWQPTPVGDVTALLQGRTLTLEEAKQIPRKLFGVDVIAWYKAEEIVSTDFYERKLAQPNSIEALTWLQSSELAFRTFGGNGIRRGYGGKRALNYVKRLYKHGAKKVTAIEVQRDQADWVRQVSVLHDVLETDTIEATDELIVEFPDDKQARAALIQQWITTFGRKKWDVPVDEGQSYLFFWWD